MAKRRKIWIVVADGAKASVYQREGRTEPLSGIHHMSSERSRLRDREIDADQPGRYSVTQGMTRHGMAPRTDSHRHLEQEFARDVAEYLDAHAAKAKLDGIVLIAAPHALGDLRDQLSDSVRAKVTKEIAKDLTHLDEFELDDHLRQFEEV